MFLGRGVVIGGRYRLERSIGAGGMGEVWAALDTRTNELVAVKALLDSARQDPELVRRFLREARAAMAVQHPNVVRIREAISIPGGSGEEPEPVIVMDFLEGESLARRLRRIERLPISAFAELFVPIVSAVDTAHRLGIIHRDLKPDNVFLVRRPEEPSAREEPRLLDFGIAKLTAASGAAGASGALTSTGAVLGTPYYMSPEQVFGDKQIDHRTDVWSLGAIAFECLSGGRLVKGDTVGQLLKAITTGSLPRLSTVAPQLPRDVGAIVDRMLAYERNERATLAEVLAVFAPFATLAPASGFAGATVRMDPVSALPPTAPAPPSAGPSTVTERVSPPAPAPAPSSPFAATLLEEPVDRRRFPRAPRSPGAGLRPPSSTGPAATTGPPPTTWPERTPPRSPARRIVVAVVVVALLGLVLGLVATFVALRLLS